MEKYTLVDWGFDAELWAQAIKRGVDEIGGKELAEYLGVGRTTLTNWANKNYTSQFHWPHMTNLLKVCNALDLDPRSFFNLEDK